MTIVFNTLQQGHLGYAAIFLCIGVGFLCIRQIDAADVSIGFWAAGFFSNALGFVLWSGTVAVSPKLYFLLGEVFHMIGFFLLAAGACMFTGRAFKKLLIFFFPACVFMWVLAFILLKSNVEPGVFLFKFVRAFIFFFSGTIVLRSVDGEEVIGRKLAGVSLLLWGLYILIFAFIKLNDHFYFGTLVGFQVLSAFGMIAMVIDRIRVRAEKSEKHARKIEGILPICSYCKKIRDEKNQWQILEAYIEDRSKAEFSHGICPECFAKHRPDR